MWSISTLESWAIQNCREDSARANSRSERLVKRPLGTDCRSLAIIGALLSLFHSSCPGHRSNQRGFHFEAASYPDAEIPEKSIAVLPFENRSDEKQNAYFADGIQDEILTNLAKIADLRVISRTSVMQYESGAERKMREIGQQLGVANVLEGSVQRKQPRQSNAQLIDARKNHQWAERYDRTSLTCSQSKAKLQMRLLTTRSQTFASRKRRV